MAIRETLNASPATLAAVLGNGKRHVVPILQRDYAWDETEWTELWAAIGELMSSAGDDSNHYLGALVLQPTGQRGEMNIIDGQQRLVTLSLLFTFTVDPTRSGSAPLGPSVDPRLGRRA